MHVIVFLHCCRTCFNIWYCLLTLYSVTFMKNVKFKWLFIYNLCKINVKGTPYGTYNGSTYCNNVNFNLHSDNLFLLTYTFAVFLIVALLFTLCTVINRRYVFSFLTMFSHCLYHTGTYSLSMISSTCLFDHTTYVVYQTCKVISQFPYPHIFNNICYQSMGYWYFFNIWNRSVFLTFNLYLLHSFLPRFQNRCFSYHFEIKIENLHPGNGLGFCFWHSILINRTFVPSVHELLI